MAFQLRQYQEEIIDRARALMRTGSRSVLIQSPTGSGKTALTAHMLGTAAQRGMVAWFVVHRRELVKQSMRTFSAVGIPYGVVAAGWFADRRQPVQIASIQTLIHRQHQIAPPRLIVWDEAHHVAAKSWAKIHASFPDALHVGLTATPERLDGTGLSRWFETMVHGPSVGWLIEQGFLAPYRIYAPGQADLSGLHTRMGDYVRREAESAMETPTLTGDAVAHYLRFASGRRAVVFCCSVRHSQHVVEQFTKAGVPAEHVDGETRPADRDAALKRFASGETLVVSNVELFGEGFDLPELEVAILLRPTQSLGMHLQQVGRVLRPSPGKQEALILDHAGNTLRHGLPDDEREWSLQGRLSTGQAQQQTGPPVRQCARCFAMLPASMAACRYCGFVPERDGREVPQVEGDLVEVDLEQVRRLRKREQGRAESFDDLVALGAARGYKRPHLWAKHVMNARQARKLAGMGR